MKWEYRIEFEQDWGRSEERIKLLNLAGQEGWELVAVTNPRASQPVLYFKRPIS